MYSCTNVRWLTLEIILRTLLFLMNFWLFWNSELIFSERMPEATSARNARKMCLANTYDLKCKIVYRLKECPKAFTNHFTYIHIVFFTVPGPTMPKCPGPRTLMYWVDWISSNISICVKSVFEELSVYSVKIPEQQSGAFGHSRARHTVKKIQCLASHQHFLFF